VPISALSHPPPARAAFLTAMSDESGAYRFQNVPPGRYTLRAHVSGGFVEFEEGREVVVEKDRPVGQLDFRLTPFKKGQWKRFTQFNHLAHDYVGRIFQASDGAMWFGTLAGVSRFDGKEFVSFTRENGLPLHAGGERGYYSGVWAIAEAPVGVLWFATGAGLCRHDTRQPGLPRQSNAEAGLSVTMFTSNNGLPDN